jgi:2-methylcitrate dehydratase
VHAQSAIEGAIELRLNHSFSGSEVAPCRSRSSTSPIRSSVAAREKTEVRTKEQADHSLPYMLAAALCNGHLVPEQYAPRRISDRAIQRLIRRVSVRPNGAFSARFPSEMPCRVVITLTDGRRFEGEKHDYEGFHCRPIAWESVAGKFHSLAAPYINLERRNAIIDAVAEIERLKVRELTALFGAISPRHEPLSGGPP